MKHTLFSPTKKTSMYHFAWHITRPWLEINKGQTDLYYVIKSGQVSLHCLTNKTLFIYFYFKLSDGKT